MPGDRIPHSVLPHTECGLITIMLAILLLMATYAFVGYCIGYCIGWGCEMIKHRLIK